MSGAIAELPVSHDDGSGLNQGTERLLFLHVGRGKTGTTSLQAALAANRERLLHAGCAYPLPPAQENDGLGLVAANASWLFGSPAALPFQLQGQATREDMIVENFRRWLPLFPPTQKCIVSSEFLWGLSEDALRNIAHLIAAAGFRPVVIAYLREQADHLVSWYCQNVRKRRIVAPLAEVFLKRATKLAADDTGMDASNYDVAIGKLERAFDSENILPRVWQRDRLVGGGTSADFLAQLGVGLPLSLSEPSMNQSAGVVEVEAMRRIMISGEYPDIRISTLSKIALKRGALPVRDFIAQVAPEIVEDFRAAYRASNERVRARYFNSQTLLFDMAPFGEQPSTATIEAEVADLVRAYRKRRARETRPANLQAANG
ncbi:hypothetical protein [Sphingomonas sp. ID0503]|uniref:hypothetical protein n=1 Tax=Sphingomonas sp. ID0503 TaxID=3399691 RepID=UPI003AFAE2D6